MSASEYLPLYQSFTNRTHSKKGHWFDHSEIPQIIDASKCCLEMYGRYVNSSITYILVSVCPADGIISHCPIWVDTIKKWISIEIRRVSVDWYKAAYVVDILSWLNFGLSKGSRIPRPPATWLKEAVSIWNPLENLSRRSLLRLWQTADFHDTAQIVTNNFTFFRNPTLNCPHFEDSR